MIICPICNEPKPQRPYSINCPVCTDCAPRMVDVLKYTFMPQINRPETCGFCRGDTTSSEQHFCKGVSDKNGNGYHIAPSPKYSHCYYCGEYIKRGLWRYDSLMRVCCIYCRHKSTAHKDGVFAVTTQSDNLFARTEDCNISGFISFIPRKSSSYKNTAVCDDLITARLAEARIDKEISDNDGSESELCC